MKRLLSLLLTGSTLLFCSFAQALDVYTVDDLSIDHVRTTSSGKSIYYLNIGGTPSLNSTTGSYDVPAIAAREVYTSLPGAAATGDATPQSALVGKPVTLSVPGGNLVQLADGTWTDQGLTPSSDLQDAWEDAQDGSVCGPPVPTADNLGNVPPVGSILDVPFSGDNMGGMLGTVDRCKITGAWSQLAGDPNYPNQGSYWRYGSFVKINVGNKQLIAGYTTVSSSTPLTYPTDNCADPSENLPEALQPKLENWGNNDLPEDIKNACTGGQNCSPSGEVSDNELNGWMAQNGNDVLQAIQDAISGGNTASGTDGSNTGANQVQSGQLAGIQNTLNGIGNDVDSIADALGEGLELTGSATLPDANSYDTNFTQPEEVSLADTVSAYIANGLPLSQFIQESGFSVRNIDPQLTCALWGESINFDISPMQSILHWMGLIVFAVSTISAFMIVIKR